MFLMSNINSIEKALEHLAMNQKGKISELNIINDNLILKVIESGFLTVHNEEYTFNENGVDFYCSEYGNDKKSSFLGL